MPTEILHKSGIYRILNIVTDDCYIGSAANFNARWVSHVRQLRRGNHHNIILQRAWNKHGEEFFSFERLLVCSKSNLLMYEQAVIDGYKPTYNICRIAGSQLGLKRSAETIAKLRKSHLGRKASDAARLNLSIAGKNKILSLEAKAKISALGRRMSEATKLKMSLSKIGIKKSDDVRKKISAAHIGKKHSVEAKLKMSVAAKLRYAKPWDENQLSLLNIGMR